MFFLECLRGFAAANQATYEVVHVAHNSELRPLATANLSEDRQPLLSETALPDYD